MTDVSKTATSIQTGQIHRKALEHGLPSGLFKSVSAAPIVSVINGNPYWSEGRDADTNKVYWWVFYPSAFKDVTMPYHIEISGKWK